MEFCKDFRELCSLLTAKSVEFLIVGGYAVAFHGAPRFTGDLDIFIRPDPGHVARMLEALREFGFPTEDVNSSDLVTNPKVLRLGRVPFQVHMMTTISGVGWEQAWASREAADYAGTPVSFIGRSALIANKLAAGRAKDLADVEALGYPQDRPSPSM